jgi:hypothetical protein
VVNDIEQRQLALEAEAFELGVDRYWQKIEEPNDNGKPRSWRNLDGAADLIESLGLALTVCVEARQKAKEGPEGLLLGLPARVWSAITVNTVFCNPMLPAGLPYTATALEVMQRAIEECNYRIAKAQDAELAAKLASVERIKHPVKSRRRLVAETMHAEQAPNYRELFLNTKARLWVGTVLLVDMVHWSEGALERQVRWERGRRQKAYLAVTNAGAQKISAACNLAAASKPARLPMVAPPKPWRIE